MGSLSPTALVLVLGLFAGGQAVSPSPAFAIPRGGPERALFLRGICGRSGAEGLSAKRTGPRFGSTERNLLGAQRECKKMTRRELQRILRVAVRNAAQGAGGHAEAMKIVDMIRGSSIAYDSQTLYLLSQLWVHAARQRKLSLEDLEQAAEAMDFGSAASGHMLEVCAVLAENGDSNGRSVDVCEALGVLELLQGTSAATERSVNALGCQLCDLYADALSLEASPDPAAAPNATFARAAFSAALYRAVGGSTHAVGLKEGIGQAREGTNSSLAEAKQEKRITDGTRAESEDLRGPGEKSNRRDQMAAERFTRVVLHLCATCASTSNANVHEALLLWCVGVCLRSRRWGGGREGERKEGAE